MGVQKELWIILSEDENDQIWQKIYSDFNFKPSINSDIIPFTFKIPFDVYDIKDSTIYKEDDLINKKIKSIFIECMEDDDYMYALDWQHTCFKYNPRIEVVMEYPVFIADERYLNGGYNVYFPEFYPNGDYYFFIDKDFEWGYLTHPWQKKIWIFGNRLMSSFRGCYKELGFKI